MKIKTRAAACAHFVRTDLKQAFPGIKFSVTSENFSMGNSVNVSWIDGPTEKEIEAVIGKYEQGHFDGMTDMYEYSNSRDDIPQTKYLMLNRRCGIDHAQYAESTCPGCGRNINAWY